MGLHAVAEEELGGSPYGPHKYYLWLFFNHIYVFGPYGPQETFFSYFG